MAHVDLMGEIVERAGGSSQLETWDPKPGRPTGGPFKAIPTVAIAVGIDMWW